jgi:hypothetical protein
VFASFAPCDNPQYVVVVMLPDSGYGADAAAPAVKQIYDGIYGLEGQKPALPGGHLPTALPKMKRAGLVSPHKPGKPKPAVTPGGTLAPGPNSTAGPAGAAGTGGPAGPAGPGGPAGPAGPGGPAGPAGPGCPVGPATPAGTTETGGPAGIAGRSTAATP